VNEDNVAAVYNDFALFSALTLEEKKAFARPDLWFQRGWTPPNTEVAVASGGQPDFKECYFAAPLPVDEEAEAQYPALYPKNIWPTQFEGFAERYTQLGAQLHGAGAELLVACARALTLPDDAFEKRIHGAPHVTRVLKYLPLNEAQVRQGVLWGEEHTDFNLLTLLPGGRFFDSEGAPCGRPDDKSGLFLRTRATPSEPNGRMVQGSAPAGCIVAQVGQQLEILSGGAFLATPHVVTAPGKPGFCRYSSAHFIHLHSNEVLFPLPELRTRQAVQNYAPPVLAGTYSIKTLVDIGLAPKEAIDALGYRHYDRLAVMRAKH
jgi:isopenicillin N synthase-like dioxygenase